MSVSKVQLGRREVAVIDTKPLAWHPVRAAAAVLRSFTNFIPPSQSVTEALGTHLCYYLQQVNNYNLSILEDTVTVRIMRVSYSLFGVCSFLARRAP